jgi:hypothetical protein
VGFVRSPELKEAIAQSEEVQQKVVARLDLHDAIREQAQRDERRMRERFR